LLEITLYVTLKLSVSLLNNALSQLYMLIKRQDIENQERAMLAPYAALSSASRGRDFAQDEDEFRTCFQRDRDRVIHSKAFRRLNGKTQVFISGYGDHYRSRLTHSMEVAQFSRDIARMLNLNQDLAETIGLAHDLGHTPFGHAGQDAMHEIMKTYGSRFEHNEQSYRVVDMLEEKSDQYRGLNLTFEVRDGLLKHRTDYDRPKAFDNFMPTLEGQIVNLADEIAYQNHDVDDGLRSGILTIEALREVKIVRHVTDSLPKNLSVKPMRYALISGLMAMMISDMANQTNSNIDKTGIRTIEDIYKTETALASYSKEMTGLTDELKQFLYKNFYMSEAVAEYNERGKQIISDLFGIYYSNPEQLPVKYQKAMEVEEKHIVIKDYIAGMTDSFATELFNKLGN